MKQFKTLILILTLLTVAGWLTYFTIQYNWHYELMSYIIFLITFIYIVIIERKRPLRSGWKMNRKQLKTDVLHLLFSAAVFDAIAKILALSVALSIHPYVFKAFEHLETWPFLINLILANLVGEFLPYLYHRISHVGNPKSKLSLFLWKIHAIHHIPNQMNWYKTSWVHPINMFLNTFLKTLPILYLGFSEEILFSVGVIHIVISYLSHANIQTEKTVLDYLIVTPHLHHFHHSINLNEAKNFGNIFPFWDLVFGSYYNRKGAVDAVGVLPNDKWNYPNHQNYVKQILFPLFNSNDKN